ncbi:MAG: hypothetical protein ACO1QR_12570 [Chthoniobacteraceae bacterium]
MLNHLPVVGALFALLLLSWAILRSSAELKKVALGAFVIVAALSIPAYLTGEPAEELAENIPGVMESVMEPHEDSAKIAFALILAVGAVALGGLLVLRTKAVPQWFATSVLVLALAAAGSLAWTANLGGKIRHPELENAPPESLSTSASVEKPR